MLAILCEDFSPSFNYVSIIVGYLTVVKMLSCAICGGSKTHTQKIEIKDNVLEHLTKLKENRVRQTFDMDFIPK